VHEQPRQPGDEAAEVQALDVGDGPGAPDRRERSLVAVAKRRRITAGDASADHATRMAALLHRNRSEPGIDADLVRFGVADADHVAECEHLGVAGQAQIRLDGDAPGAIDLRAGGLTERAGKRGRLDAGSPDDGLCRDALARATRRSDFDVVGLHVDDCVG
jgi:hypothetical protein